MMQLRSWLWKGAARGLCVGLVLMLALVWGTAIWGTARAADEIRIGGSSGTSTTMIWMADEIGAFERHGVAVEIVPFDAGWRSVKALQKGEIDLATATGYAFVKMGLKDPDLMAVSKLTHDEDNGIVARRDHGIENPADLRGRRVGLTLGTSGEFFLAQFLLSAGIPTDAVTLVDLKPGEIVEHLVAGKIDAGSSWDPWNYRASKALDAKATVFPVQSGQGAVFLLLGHRPWLGKNKAVLAQVLRALDDAEKVINGPGGEKVVVEMYRRRLDFDPAFSRYVHAKQRNGLGLPQSLLGRLEAEARWLSRSGDAGAVPNYLDRLFFDGLDTVKPGSVSVFR